MPVKVVESNLNVLQAAKIRIRNVFANGCKIYLSFSSGKDSLCMANLVYEMILSGELDPKQLTVTFIDEEGLYPSMVDAAYRWRRNFLSVGAKFLWFCLPFKQVSVIDHLSSSESWRCLDAQAARLCHHVQSLPPLCRGNELPDVLLQGVF